MKKLFVLFCVSLFIAVIVFIVGFLMCAWFSQGIRVVSREGGVVVLSALYISMVIAVSAYLVIATRK